MSESTQSRPQPPSIQDPKSGDAPLWLLGSENMDDGGAEPEQYDTEEEEFEYETDQPNWTRRAKDAWRFSTSFVDSNYRRLWDDSIRAFNNQHPGDSKYNSEIFKKRSHLFVPKTRAIVRKNEAAAAAAFFSNLDRISVSAQNQNDQQERVSADVMQQLLQYRLTKSIAWFQIVLGGMQDAQIQGASVAHVYWRYSMKRDAKGKLVRHEDKPCVDLVPIENFRFDPSANWTDPINSSPYLIHVIPMFAVDVKARMTRPDPKGRQWKSYPDSALVADGADDSTRRTRVGNQQDPALERRSVSDYDIVFVHRHIHRWDGTDYEFLTLRSERMLTDPEPLEMTVFHGRRPYVMGSMMIETHKPMAQPLPNLVKDLQEEINEIKNQRLDNVKFVLNKGYFAKRGKNVDLPALVRNVPGRVVLMDDPTADVVENQWQDVTQSAYLEEDRNTANFDELVGNFSSASVQTARSPREPARAMTLLQAPANMLTEYALMTYSETFVVPILRQLVLLEQHYETDQNILNLAGQKSKQFQKFGMDKVTDDLLEKEMVVNVNVGMGNTDPVTKMQKFLAGINSFAAVAARPPPGMNLSEVWKEIAALSGYQDGERFTIGNDPEVIKLQQQNQQLMQAIQKLMQERKDKSEANQVKLETNRQDNIVKLLLADKEDTHQNLQLYAKHLAQKDMLESSAAQKAMQQQPGAAPAGPVPRPQTPAQAMPGQGLPGAEQLGAMQR
jgi:hypothetical protein